MAHVSNTTNPIVQERTGLKSRVALTLVVRKWSRFVGDVTMINADVTFLTAENVAAENLSAEDATIENLEVTNTFEWGGFQEKGDLMVYDGSSVVRQPAPTTEGYLLSANPSGTTGWLPLPFEEGWKQNVWINRSGLNVDDADPANPQYYHWFRLGNRVILSGSARLELEGTGSATADLELPIERQDEFIREEELSGALVMNRASGGDAVCFISRVNAKVGTTKYGTIRVNGLSGDIEFLEQDLEDFLGTKASGDHRVSFIMMYMLQLPPGDLVTSEASTDDAAPWVTP